MKWTKDENTKQYNIDEDAIYEEVMLEIEEDNKIKSAWAKAIVQSEGDDKKVEFLYKIRVDFLINEEIKRIEIEREEAEELELLLEKEQYRIKQEEMQQIELERKKAKELALLLEQEEKNRAAEIEQKIFKEQEKERLELEEKKD